MLLAHDLPDSGQALGLAAGLAHAERLMAQRHGRSLVDHRVWLFAETADLECGAAQEAAAASVLLRLERLVVIACCRDADATLLAGFSALGWAVRRVAQAGDLPSALSASQRSRRPTLIACPKNLVFDDCGVAQEPGRGGVTARRVWLRRLARHGGRAEFERMVAGRLPARWHDALTEPNAATPGAHGRAATAATVRAALARLTGPLGELCLLSTQNAWSGRVHAMAGVLCGLALHGGLLPVGSACLSDLDSLLPQLRMAAAQGLRMVQLLTEPDARGRITGRRAAVRAIPNLFVFRPADAFEALECIELALRRTAGPTVVLLSEEQVPLLSDRPSRTHAARGGYLVRGSGPARDVTLLASGAEVALAMVVAERLAESGLRAAVASLPCWTLFGQQDAGWRDAVLGRAPIVGIERGSGFGWSRWIGADGLFLDPDEVGTSLAQAILRFLQKPGKSDRLVENTAGAG